MTPSGCAPILPPTRPRPRLVFVLAIPLLLAFGACGAPDEAGDIAPQASSAAPDEAATADRPLPTADPFARGYTREDFPRVQEIAPGVFTYEQLRSAGEEWFTTVSMFVVTDEGVLVADGQGNLEETQRLVDHIADITAAPITHLVVASDHGDHTGGNAAFPEDVRVWAHPTSAEQVAAASPEGAGARPVTDRVDDRAEITLGDRRIELHFLGRAHTGGDLAVYLPDDRVLFLSEAYLHRVFPAMRSAYPTEWVAMIERAQAMDVDIYVPGHGFVDAPAVLEEELETFRQAIVAVIAEARRLHEGGVPMETAMEQATFGEFESWSLRSSQGPRAVQQVYAELEGRLR
ncbi:MAG: MBL fold metallo-hydrolase [Gemmatimonadetes bacterium]|nr:MBL fold metallo-hydrolase [Gemmatimonadota bacterium]MBT8402388.1 MBL fold metallo-hydrolase [Gemmatimonadota bacterium]NNF39096.1 MBL fold metallo-hydrolase [Gemmatimonadota bacterium]NNK62592.1 MBL fold metallo-hydrolase [Gemmatimonadota bacterium]